jgi:hypothetical protein
MKAAVLALGLAAGLAQAEVIECPARHAGAPLLGASMYEGAQKQYELMGESKEVRGGLDVHFGFDAHKVKWLACWYGKGDVVEWRQVSAGATKCALRERKARGGEVSVRLSCT